MGICHATEHQCPFTSAHLSKFFPPPPPQVPLYWTLEVHNQQLVNRGGGGVRGKEKLTTSPYLLKTVLGNGQRFNQVKAYSSSPSLALLSVRNYVSLRWTLFCFDAFMNCRMINTVLITYHFHPATEFPLLFCGENI